MNKNLMVFLTLLTLGMGACSPGIPATQEAEPATPAPLRVEPVTLTVMTHDSFAASE